MYARLQNKVNHGMDTMFDLDSVPWAQAGSRFEISISESMS